MKKSILIIMSFLFVTTLAFATCYFNWSCSKCNKFAQTSSYSCNGEPSKPYPSGCNSSTNTTWASHHDWVMTGYFERKY